MKYINEMHESDRLKDIYLCKSCQSAQTKNGKTYWNVTLQDKTGAVNAKDPDLLTHFLNVLMVSLAIRDSRRQKKN